MDYRDRHGDGASSPIPQTAATKVSIACPFGLSVSSNLPSEYIRSTADMASKQSLLDEPAKLYLHIAFSRIKNRRG